MLIQRVPSVVIRVAAQGISFIHFSRFMAEFKVVLLEFNLPHGSTRSYFLGFTPVCEVFMVSLDDDRLI